MEKYMIADFETYAREPILRRMKDGSLICMFLTGGKTEPENLNYTAVSRSYDDGKTWSRPEKLFDHKTRGVWCTEVFNDGEYPMAVVHTYNSACYYRELETFYAESYDNGKTWTEPVSFPGCIGGCSLRQGITLSNGDVLFPLYWQEAINTFDWASKGFGKCRFRSGVGIRPKNEKSWQRFGYFADDDFDIWEPNAVEVADGHIIMYMRTETGYLCYGESFDYGRSWSSLKKTNILHSNAKITCLKVKDKIVLINNSVAEGRTHLNISVSCDGVDFTHICYIENAEDRYFYPHAFADDENNTLYVAYENGKTHYLAKIPYEELGL